MPTFAEDGDRFVDVVRDFLDEGRDDLGPAAVAAPAEGVAPEVAGLSPRELEVLAIVAAGKTNQQIADALVISAKTAANHVSHILNKTGLSNRTELAAYAASHRLNAPPGDD